MAEEKTFRVLTGFNASNDDRFDVDGEQWPVEMLSPKDFQSALSQGAIEIIQPEPVDDVDEEKEAASDAE